MKKLILLVLIAATTMATASAFFYNGTQYINCADCQSEAEFAALAESYASPGLTVVVVNSQAAMETGDLYANIRSYRLSFRVIINPPGGISPRLRLTQSQLRQPERQAAPIFIQIPTSASAMADFGEYLDTVTSHFYPQFSGVVDLNIGLSNWPYTANVHTVRAQEFISQYSDRINGALSTASFNPFFFTQKALAVRIKTTNKFLVTLVNTAEDGEQPVWKHLLTRYIPKDFMVVEPSYATTTIDTDQLEGEMCESFKFDELDKAGLFCLPAAGTPFARRFYPPGYGSGDPRPCLPVEPDCSLGETHFYLGVEGEGDL